MKTKKNATEAMSEERLAELKANASEILAFCRQQVLYRHPFCGAVAMGLELVPVRDRRCPTAMTDGKSVFFDISFLGSLSQAEREFVLGHEIWHVIMMHFLRSGDADRETFNIAADMEVNQLLEADGFEAPADALFPNKSHSRRCEYDFPSGLSAEEYYALLMKEDRNKRPQDSQGGEGQDGKGQGKGKGRQQKGSPCKGQFDRHFDKSTDYEAEANAGGEAKDKYGAKGVDPDFSPASVRTEGDEREAVERVREAVVSAAQQTERTCGSLPGHVKRIVDALLEPKLPWRELLAAFMTSSMDCRTNWSAPNRRFAWSGTYLPSHAGEQVRVAIGIDVSGSCTDDCRKFLTEVAAIAKSFGSYELHVIQCDTEVKAYDKFDEGNPLDWENGQIELKGFGGTRLRPIFDYITLNELDVDAVIVFTDGECEEFDDDCGVGVPVLWALAGASHRDNLKVGEQIAIGDGD